MKTENLVWLILAIPITIILLWWLTTVIKNSFKPLQGEIYLLRIFGWHWFEVRLGDPAAKWFQKLLYYVLIEPFNRGSFIYEWTQQITYEDYLKRKRFVENKKDYDISIVWQPKYKDSELGSDGLPKDKTTLIIVSRKEKMFSLKKNESFTLAVEFETKNGWRGWRLFTLFLEIESLSLIISEFRHWQQASVLTFKGEYNSWSKTVEYATLRTTTMNNLDVELGKDKTSSFIDEINSQTIGFGYKVKSIKEGDIYLSAESADLQEAQEEQAKSEYRRQAAEADAETTKIKAQADGKATVIKAEAESEKIKKIAEAEAEKIKTIGVASNQILEERILKLKELYGYQKDLITAKYGKDGLKDLKFYIEGNGQGADANTQRMVDTLLGLNIHEEMRQEGGAS